MSALRKRIAGRSFDEVVEATKAALATEGFGVLTEIDARATFKKKLDVDFPPFLMLGACNPPLALRALIEAPEVGTLLPCNVVVRAVDGEIEVHAVDPERLLAAVDRPSLGPVAREVSARLVRVIAAI